jgi:hypothetical protein
MPTSRREPFWTTAMTTQWTVRDKSGRPLAGYDAVSRLEVARKLVPSHFDAFRLEVSSSYREVFERAVMQILKREGWEIVCLDAR